MPDVGRTRPSTQPHISQNGTSCGDGGSQGGSLPAQLNNPRKRTREELSEFGGEDDADEDEEAESRAAQMAESKRQRDLAIQRTMQERDKDGYLPGSIVRVKLLHFVTYDEVEFRPGPYLNMIIGPNGTGKSTIVCAIALGLGWRPNVLGRAKDVSAFVKQGYDMGSIEIELKGHAGKRNVRIRREISRSDNRSDWYIDGQKSTQKEVDTRVHALDIKIGNLCSFLPQDKVADFARMSPPELLKEVQKAAGEEGLISEHEKLTELGRSEVKIADKLSQREAEVENLKQRQEVLERDVRRFKERQAIERQVKTLEVRIPQLRYTLARAEVQKLKPMLQRRKARAEHARRYIAPFEEVKEDLEETSEKLRLRRDKCKNSLDKVASDLRKCASSLEKKEEEADKKHRDMASLDQREAKHRAFIESLKAEVRDLQDAVVTPPEVANTQAVDDEIKHIRIKQRALESERVDLKAQQEQIALENRSLRATLEDSRKKLEALDNVRHQRLAMLRNWDKATFEGVNWLRENQHLFSGKVYDPVFLEMSIKDPRYTLAVEATLNMATLKTFVCELRSDYDIFTRELVDKQGKRLNVVEVEGFDDNLTRGVLDAAALNEHGFEACAIDLVQAPIPVLKYLGQNNNLHRIPLSLKENRDPRALERMTEHPHIRRFVYGTTNYNVSESAYGQRKRTTVSNRVGPHLRWFTQSVDENRKRELERSVKECDETARQSETKVTELSKREQSLRAELQTLEERRIELVAETKAANAARLQYERDLNKLATKKKHLKEALNRPSTEVERTRIRATLRKLAAERASLAQDIQSLMQQQHKLRMDYDIHFLEGLQHEANLTAFNDLLRHAESQLESAIRSLEDGVEREKEVRTTAKKLLERYKELFDNADPEIQQAVDEASSDESARSQSIDDLERELETQRTALEFAHGISDEVIATYESRQREIAKLTSAIEELTAQKADLDAAIKEIRDHWEPAIRSLVAEVSQKFSNAFDRIGCAGEIRVATDRDYDKWGIEILVKFRDTEELQLLTGQRQSGGERSLSTIMFLMGLTELGKSPFSLVDEINQGMDQRAERAVHNQMVEVTCGEHARQYFLITPKLLNNLRYHERMRVLIINNGEWLPPNFSFQAALKQHLRKQLAGTQA